MNDPVDSQEMIVHNQQALEELAWAIESSAGKFSLILARCNYAKLRDRMVQQLHQICTMPLQEIALQPASQTLYTTIRDALGNEPPGGVLVFGLEAVKDLDHLLSLTNQVREEFRTHFPFPLVVWVTDEIHQKLMRLASDFESWATTTEFTIPPDALLSSLRQGVDRLWSHLLQEKPELSFMDLLSQVGELGFLHRGELNAALQELEAGQVLLEPQLQADLALVQGLWVEDDRAAMSQLEQSLSFWQNREEDGKSQNQAATAPNAQLKRGLIHYFLGRRGYSLLDQTKEPPPDWETISTSLKQAIAQFEQANRPDLVAKCLNRLMRVLNSQQHWSEVETLARRSLDLQAVAPSSFRLVYAQGFLAEAMLRQDRAGEAYDLARQVLETVKTLPPESQWLRPLYLLYLAWAARKLGKPQEAIAHLVEARELGDQGQPTIYRHILETLGELYFEQKHYLEAFEVKRERLSIEQQYGIRAFVGAGRLQPKREAINPEKLEAGQIPVRPKGMVAPEIATAGRQQDLERLIERIGRNDYRLIVVHGSSGVGKSSLVNAGLVPALRHQAIGYQQNLPVVLRVYTHWEEELDRRLTPALGDDSVDGHKPTVETLVEKLRHLEQRHLRCILIFDQFEEFFFTYPRPEQRRPFFQFLAGCLQVLSVKVILSLREDYLHFMLECGRLGGVEATGIDILSQNVRYYLGNFSAADTRAIIQNLTECARFYLEPDLVEQLVQDLASDLGEVRPIELQVVGAQLQEDQITTLVQYRALGDQPKETLVERYLQAVVNSCGQENQQMAELVLYLLTDEKGTRPLKTRAELQKELQEFAAHRVETDQSLDLVLRIFVDSGLVLLLPEAPEDRYQLVHDYLAAFIRQQKGSKLSELINELALERKHRQQAELREKLSQDRLTHIEQANQILADVQKKASREAAYPKSWISLKAGVAALAVAGCVGIIRLTGILQTWEWTALDQFFSLRPSEPVDKRLVVVGIDEADLQKAKQWPLPDITMAQLLQKIQTYQPRAIGLDIYRDLPVEPGHAELLKAYREIPHLVGIEQIKDRDSAGIPAPPILGDRGQVGFNNLIFDADGKVRRGLLYWTVDDGKTHESLILKLSLLYLKAEGITPQPAISNSDYLQLGNVVFRRFETNDGAYIRADDGGYQILANLRGPINTIPTVSMNDVLEGRVSPAMLRDRIVLIGSTAISLKDFFYTSYSHSLGQSPQPISGVELQAQFVSQVLSAALDERGMIQVWAEPLKWLWIVVWAYLAAEVAWKIRSSQKGILVVVLLGFGLIIICYKAFLMGWWVPLVPALLAIFSSAITIGLLKANELEKLRLQRTTELLAEVHRQNSFVGCLAIEFFIRSISDPKTIQKARSIVEVSTEDFQPTLPENDESVDRSPPKAPSPTTVTAEELPER